MEKAYTICIIIGFGVPLFSLIVGAVFDAVDGVFHGISHVFEGFHLDFCISIGNASICLLPISLLSICGGLLIFGSVGKLMPHQNGYLIANIVGGACGYLVAVGLQSLLNRLKKVENTTYAQDQLLLFDTTVINTIPSGKFGSVSIKSLDGITSTYPAKAEDVEKSIRQDTKVRIIRFENNIAIVEPIDLSLKYEDQKSDN